MTVTFAVGAPCAGDAHFTVTVTPSPGQPVVLTRSKADYRQALSADEREKLAELLVRLLVNQLPGGTTAAEAKAAVEATTVDITVAMP